MSLTQRIPELEAPSEPRESPETPTETAESPTTPEEPRTWWRRIIGG
jgi:hypothetical protein